MIKVQQGQPDLPVKQVKGVKGLQERMVLLDLLVPMEMPVLRELLDLRDPPGRTEKGEYAQYIALPTVEYFSPKMFKGKENKTNLHPFFASLLF